MSTAPTGEPLPDYDDDPGPVNPAALLAWVRRHRPLALPTPHDLNDDNQRYVNAGHLDVVRAVLQALQAVGDATLVKNATYRAMRADGAAVERLGAWLIGHDHAGAVVEADGDVVRAAVGLLEAAR